MEKYSINADSIVHINRVISVATEDTETDEKKEKLFQKNKQHKNGILYRFRNSYILLNCLLALFIDGMLYVNVESFFPLHVQDKYNKESE